MITGSKDLIRSINKKLVLKEIIKNEPVSRASLAKKLGLTKATVSSIVQELLSLNIIQETGSFDTEKGRKPILINFNSDAGYALSISIDTKIITVLLASLYSDKKQIKQVSTPVYNKITDSIIEIVNSFEKNISSSYYGLIGIAICINSKDFLCSNNSDNNIIKILESYYNVPVYLENKVRFCAVAEKAAISKKHSITYKNIFYIDVDTELSAGIITDNHLYKGHNGLSGELNHYIIEPAGHLCDCGKRGCLKQYLSIPAILNNYGELSDLINGITEKEPTAINLVNSFLYYLSIFIHNIKAVYNPELVIINSPITNQFPDLLIKNTKLFPSDPQSGTNIITSNTDNSFFLTGGIYICVTQFLMDLVNGFG